MRIWPHFAQIRHYRLNEFPVIAHDRGTHTSSEITRRCRPHPYATNYTLFTSICSGTTMRYVRVPLNRSRIFDPNSLINLNTSISGKRIENRRIDVHAIGKREERKAHSSRMTCAQVVGHYI